MQFLFTAVRKDLGRLRRDPLALVTSLGIPLVLVTLITLVFSGRRDTPQGRLLVSDEDRTPLSRALLNAVSREQLSKVFVIEYTSRPEGRRRMDRGEASALLVIPQGFQNAFAQDQPVQLQLLTNPSQEILPNIVEETLSIVVDGAFYLQRLAPVPLRNLASAQGRSDNTSLGLSIAFAQLSQRFAKYLNPPLIDVQMQVTAQRQDQNVAALFFPAVLFMGLLFIGNAHALDIWKEQSWGTLRRLAAAPVSLAEFLGGRLISLALILSLVALVGVAGMRWFAHVPVASVLLATLWLVLSGTAFYLFLLAIAVHSSGQRAASVIGNLVVFPLALVGGSFFPFEMMPNWMASIGRLTPNGWAVNRFKAFVDGSAHAGDFWIGAASMAAVGSILFLLALRRMRTLA